MLKHTLGVQSRCKLTLGEINIVIAKILSNVTCNHLVLVTYRR